MRVVREGDVSFVIFDGVFYNPLASFTRTIGVLAISAFSKYVNKSLTVIDSLAATGIRGLRYYKESKGSVAKIIFNDKNPMAYRNILYNVKINNIRDAEIYNLDFNIFIPLVARGLADVIDVDPFGTPSPYIDLSISMIRNKGMVAITATDLTALCGLYPSAAYRKYFSSIIKTEFCHEAALRILIKELVIAGGRHNRIVKPLMSIFTEQYARVYVYVYDGKAGYPKENIGYIELSRDGYLVKEDPSEIEGPYIGPLWIGPLHDKYFIETLSREVEEIICYDDKLSRRINKLLRFMDEEIDLPPYSYKVSNLASQLKISPPKVSVIINLLKELGYKAGRSHLGLDYIKTNAPYETLLDLLRSESLK